MMKRSDSVPNRPPPTFNPRALNSSMAPPPPRPGAAAKMPYADLRARTAAGTLSGLQTGCLETHLSSADFQRVFEMTCAEFEALPAWGRVALRKKSKLHVPQ